jgi:UDP-N-acetylglucosamine acyltransferase
MMTAKIHPTAVIDKSAEFGADVEVGPGCVIGPNVKLGDRTRLIAHVFIESHTELGKDNTVFPFAALGGQPQDLSYKGEPTRLVIGDNNSIREHATLHRGTVRGHAVTTIGNHCLIMGNAHIAHDCTLGDHVILAQTATLGGHVHIADHVFVGGVAAIHQHGRVGRHAFVGACALMTTDLIPFGSAIGNHAHLAGLNVVGLKRKGFTREQIHDLRAAYRLLFAEEGTFQERIEDCAQLYADNPEVMEIVAFVRADAARSLCMPRD